MAAAISSSYSASSQSEWLEPEVRPDRIDTLIHSVDRYNPNNVGILEDYLLTQLREDEYDCLANLAILKMYQFNPTLSTPEVIINILLKAIAHAPFSPDFSLCMAMLGDRLSPTNPAPQTLPIFTFLANLSSILLSRKFALFWSSIRSATSPEANSIRQFIAEIKGFEARVRTGIAKVVEGTFRSLNKSRLEKYLGLENEDAALAELVKGQGWKLEGDLVLIPPNAENTPRATIVHEDLQIGQLARLLNPV